MTCALPMRLLRRRLTLSQAVHLLGRHGNEERHRRPGGGPAEPAAAADMGKRFIQHWDLKPIFAELARRFAKGILAVHNLENVELYPKQDKTTEDGPGSLIRLPFVIHRKSGTRYPFVTPGGETLAETVSEQIGLLASAQAVPERMVEIYADTVPDRAEINP